jgi:hypothetical protein
VRLPRLQYSALWITIMWCSWVTLEQLFKLRVQSRFLARLPKQLASHRHLLYGWPVWVLSGLMLERLISQ